MRSHARPSASIDMGPHTRNGVGPNLADDTGYMPRRQNVYVIDAPRDDSVAPERQKRVVVQINEQTVISVLRARGRTALTRKRSPPARKPEVAHRSHARDRQPVAIDMGPRIGNGGGQNAADDMKDLPH